MTARIDKLWVVRDPSPVSMVEDVLWETNASELVTLALGPGLRCERNEHTALYTDEAEACADALARLRRRG